MIMRGRLIECDSNNNVSLSMGYKYLGYDFWWNYKCDDSC